MAAGLNANPAFLNALVNNLDSNVILDILDQTGTFMTGIAASLMPETAGAIAAGLNANAAFLARIIQDLDPALLVNALNAHPSVTRDLTALLGTTNPASQNMAAGIAGGINNAQGFLTTLIANLDPVVLANALDVNPNFLRDVLAGINANVARAIAGALNTTSGHNFLIALVADLTDAAGAAMAQGMNLNNVLMPALIGNLDPNVARVAAQALGLNPGLITKVVENLDGNAGLSMATAANQAAQTNPDFMRILIQNLSPATAQALAQGLNANATANPGFLTNLLSNLNADTGKAAGLGLNGMAVGSPSPLYVTMVGIQAHTAQAIANALNNNGAFLTGLIGNLNAPALAVAINMGIDGAPMNMLRNTLANLNATVLGNVMNSPQTQNLLNQLLWPDPDPDPTHPPKPRLSGTLVAEALNNNADAGIKPLVTSLVNGLDGKALAASLSSIEAKNLLVQLLNGLNVTTLGNAVNAAPNGMLYHLGIGLYGKAGSGLGLGLDRMGLRGELYVKEVKEGALP